jgi:hypothetical protein
MSKLKPPHPKSYWRDSLGQVVVLVCVDGFVLWRRGQQVPRASALKHFHHTFKPDTSGKVYGAPVENKEPQA